ncbi:hypothetical protein CASFOL_036576 [Castilleja foliolosa]|uniref:Uncharacterized protein n=1 Tax=Castilleja foliolosa TaxID=1961234 RepID=A0ABD3BXE0_9LAMI
MEDWISVSTVRGLRIQFRFIRIRLMALNPGDALLILI